MSYLQMTTYMMAIMGVFAIIGGIVTDLGAFGIVFGMLMVVSSAVKVIALRIFKSTAPAPARPELEETTGNRP